MRRLGDCGRWVLNCVACLLNKLNFRKVCWIYNVYIICRAPEKNSNAFLAANSKCGFLNLSCVLNSFPEISSFILLDGEVSLLYFGSDVKCFIINTWREISCCYFHIILGNFTLEYPTGSFLVYKFRNYKVLKHWTSNIKNISTCCKTESNAPIILIIRVVF